MELRVLRYFLAVAREESITAAAQALHVTQPTLSKQLMELEQELGKQLFLRGSRKITLTEDGMFLRRRAEEIVRLADKTEADFQCAGETISGEVCLGCGETEAIALAAHALADLRVRHPGIRINLFSGNGEDVTERLDRGLIDFALFVGLAELKKYDYLRLPFVHHVGLLLRQDDPLAQHEAITPDDLRQTPLLCSRQMMIKNELAGWLGSSVQQLQLVGTYNLINNAGQMVLAGLGSALTIDHIANADIRGLCFRPLAPALTMDVYLAWKKYPVFSKAAEKFLKTMQRTVQ